ncbi:hypothetical protein [Glaciecola punicea]|nr:hypothetical protein [Glaciecola punicea]
MAVWGSDAGRWRNGEHNSKITFSINDTQMSILEKYSDGSGGGNQVL